MAEYKYRRVEVDEGTRSWNGWFHKFAGSVKYNGDEQEYVTAVVESSDGNVHQVEYFKIKFLDNLGEV